MVSLYVDRACGSHCAGARHAVVAAVTLLQSVRRLDSPAFRKASVMTKVTADVLLGDGTRLFDRMGPEQVKLVGTRVIDSSAARHFTFKMVD